MGAHQCSYLYIHQTVDHLQSYPQTVMIFSHTRYTTVILTRSRTRYTWTPHRQCWWRGRRGCTWAPQLSCWWSCTWQRWGCSRLRSSASHAQDPSGRSCVCVCVMVYIIEYVRVCVQDQWTKVANLISGKIWEKFEIPINVCTQIHNSVHLKCWNQESTYVGPKWPMIFIICLAKFQNSLGWTKVANWFPYSI